MPNEDAILRKALETYGSSAQINMVFEEMSELQKELCKHLRGKDNRTEIAEEIADVEIMLTQMKYLFGCESLVQDFHQQKIERLAHRLERKDE